MRVTAYILVHNHCNGGMEWWNEIVECVLQGERSIADAVFHKGDSS